MTDMTLDERRNKHASEIMVQACVAVLTLSSLLLTALLAFVGGILGDSSVSKGIIILAWLAGFSFIVISALCIYTLYTAITLAQCGRLTMDDLVIRAQMMGISWGFMISVTLAVSYFLTVKFT